jgi:hypothetical protein
LTAFAPDAGQRLHLARVVIADKDAVGPAHPAVRVRPVRTRCTTRQYLVKQEYPKLFVRWRCGSYPIT